ncbi:hypothetical protein L211DRAFT_870439 [Terfezia boudieri ATCC MYA-4762]|uniref:Uncharacterized protein n=1 Tax=Terfezia boudieri ATCC MYA-4762 TaxID=1051890 RepID=A0A3N4LRT2_9PEZI|nr:hypothetical protein L211DRAFT_870439 [Terfezia boudieri ATCC MYA-4762]
MRPLLSRLKPPRTLRALRQPNTSATPTTIASTRRTVTTTTPLRAEESLNARLKRRFWGTNTPTSTPPQVPPVAEAETEAKQQQPPWVDPTPVEGYVPKHDGRGLRVVGIVGKLGKKVKEFKVESFPTLNKVTDSDALEALLRRAVVETYTNVFYGKEADEGLVREVGGEDFTRNVEIVRGEDGGFRFLYKSKEVVEGILGQRRVVEDAEVTDAKVTDATIVEAAEAPNATAEATTVNDGAAAEPTEEVVPSSDLAEDIVSEASTINPTAAAEPTEEVVPSVNVAEGIVSEASAINPTAAAEPTEEVVPSVNVAEGIVSEASAINPTAAAEPTGGVVPSVNVAEGIVSEASTINPTAAAEPTEEVVPSANVVEDIVSEASTINPTISPLPLSPTDAWHSLPLPLPHLFAIHKRLLLTTGHRLSDQALNYSPTALDLLKSLRKAASPEPEGLDLLSLVPELNRLRNVRVLKRRLRPVDREIDKGRLSPAQREWLENKRRRDRGEEIEGEWIYKWDEGKYFVA